jgi:shikimate kinase
MNQSITSSFILIGIKHSGKTTQGQMLAKYLNCPFFDTDDIITQVAGIPPRTLYTTKGPSGFMAAEETACRKIAESNNGKKIVISTGGGICDNAPALLTLREIGTFVFIQLPEKIAADRIVSKITTDIAGNLHNLPAYIQKKDPRTEQDVRAFFHDFYIDRTVIYNTIADIMVTFEDAPESINFQHLLASLQ